MLGLTSMRRRSRPRLWLTLTLATLLAVTGGVAIAASGDTASSYSFFARTDTAPATLDPDTRPVELGLRFQSSVAGSIQAVRFLQVPGDTGSHRVTVWSADGKALASTVVTATGSGGWRQAKLPKPVAASAGRSYVVSYHTTRYRATTDFLTAPVRSGPLTAPARAGVYAYGTSPVFPTQTYLASNYWVDLVFTTTAQVPTSPSPSRSAGSPSPTATATGTATPSPSKTGSSSAGTGPQLPRVAWEGGPAYFGQYQSTAAWNNPSFFPIGVWYESVVSSDDVSRDRAAGLNTYVQLTEGSNASLIRSAGSYAIPSEISGAGSETTAWLLTDEADMIYRAGSDPWTGREGWNTCTPIQDQGGKCGYTVMQNFNDRAAKDGRPRYANYGKGVTMWDSDQDAQAFINRYQQLVSVDMYFYTDPNLCPGEASRFLGIPADKCRRSSSYGIVMDRVRALDAMDGKRQPIWAFVEVGHPSAENDAPTIQADQIAGAVMNSIIHEARGVIYFNHNFGGPCQSQHVLRDSCGAAVRPKVTETNQRLAQLARVLNTQSYQYAASQVLDTMLKRLDGSYYLFAMPGRTGGEGTQQLTLPAGVTASKAEVMFENRSVPVQGGTFTDTFANEYSYHIYKITP